MGGEVFFNDSFENNPLVNAMSVGIMKKEELIKAVAKGKGNPIYIVGSATGKDGIHGATFASADVTENTAKIDVNIIVEYGSRIPDVAFEIQNRVKKAVENMTGLTVADVNVRVAGIEVEAQ